MKDEILLAKIKRAKNRKVVFLTLDKPAMPSELATKIFKKSSSSYNAIISRALSELKKLGIVKVLNPKDKTGRVYALTAKGKKIYKLY